MSNPEENVPKTNGLGSDPMQRLASFKAPRDLSLGGVKPNKKVFIPNLNVTRNKNKGSLNVNARDHKKDDKGRKDRKNDRNKNFNKNGPNVIKSSGVFSEGLGSAERHHSARFSYGRDSDSGGTAALQKPTIRVKDVIKIDKELEEQKIKSVLGDNSILDDDVNEDFKNVNERDAPIKLPMDDGGWSVKKGKSAVAIKQEVIVKDEPKDDVDCAITSVNQKAVVDVKKEVFEDTDVVNILRNEKPTLILLQLPNALPGRGGTVDDEPRRKQTEPSTSTEDNDEKPVDNKCRLADLEEGKIGKLRVHRSGRVTLSLGDTIFEVCSGTKAAFHQEVVSLAVDDNSRSANLIAVGDLQHKLNLMPDWETMFQDMPA
ncbi:unnamed protein product [Chilo suppressalis]|uniref:DNA-directed RNA polymerase III subunit RPC4 n=1 Tax=Chilo suppressalis TaxID=168631 RepID=A0ABN8L4B4_CHISP|nr:hypothetical protein evm_002701 [Chilo suppressalis]CAH2986041.1 unnamed protein product [Chilo suppressalis]